MPRKPRPLFRTVSQHAKKDCVVACLSSILDIAYEEILVVASQVQPDVLAQGLTEDAAVKVANKFGRTLVEAPVNLRTDIGMLGVHFPNGNNHAVVLSHGLIYDPEDQWVWRAKEYLRRYKGKIIDFYELED